VIGQYEQGHGRQEQADDAEVARVTRVAAHVADREDHDPTADEGNDEQHDRGERVGGEPNRRIQ
jgi:hypothetical protein